MRPGLLPRGSNVIAAKVDCRTPKDDLASFGQVVVLARPYGERPMLERHAEPGPKDFGPNGMSSSPRRP
jgi:hypothetical protein